MEAEPLAVSSRGHEWICYRFKSWRYACCLGSGTYLVRPDDERVMWREVGLLELPDEVQRELMLWRLSK